MFSITSASAMQAMMRTDPRQAAASRRVRRTADLPPHGRHALSGPWQADARVLKGTAQEP
jgi:hypothetical protein